jgi:hypothetical protein
MTENQAIQTAKFAATLVEMQYLLVDKRDQWLIFDYMAGSLSAARKHLIEIRGFDESDALRLCHYSRVLRLMTEGILPDIVQAGAEYVVDGCVMSEQEAFEFLLAHKLPAARILDVVHQLHGLQQDLIVAAQVAPAT